LWGLCTAVIAGPSRTLLQRATPERAHGRVLSADFVAGSGAELLGVATAGLLVGAFGVQRSIIGLGLAVTSAAVVLARSDRRQGDRPRPLVPVPVDGGEVVDLRPAPVRSSGEPEALGVPTSRS
jgi:hypothetical protein